MTGYFMPRHLFACAVEGRHIFLDLQRDRYFRLTEPEEAAFAALLRQNTAIEPSALHALLRAGVLTDTADGKAVGLTSHPPPDSSLPERLDAGGRARTWLPDLVEVTTRVHAARRAVARRRLAEAFARVAADRALDARYQDADFRDQLVGRFLAVRPFAPAPPKCLHDTLALSRFLARRLIFPDIVIGVKLHPFAAHCWLQDENTVLNDALTTARDYQPVLVA